VLAHTASGRVARSRCLVRLTDVQPAAVEELCQPDDEGGAGTVSGAWSCRAVGQVLQRDTLLQHPMPEADLHT
jgi:hypothetical protein